MTEAPLRLATRNSPLALWQAETIASALRSNNPDRQVELVSMATFADKRLDLPIAELGGKGAFSKEVQQLVLGGVADLAVHSAKDLQAITPDGLTIAAVPERGDARDCLVGATLEQIVERGHEAVVATGSNRRRVQLSGLAKDARFIGLRGNIGTRLAKVGDVDAIVMANAALTRLDIAPEVVDVLEPDVMIPQVGQGTLAVECRAGDATTIAALAAIDHALTRRLLDAERAFLVELGGDCDLPAGAIASVDDVTGVMTMRAMLASPDESIVRRVEHSGEDGVALGTQAACELRAAVSP